jgi:hypothetical protein
VGFESTIPAFKRAKAVHTLDSPATVIGPEVHYHVENSTPLQPVLNKYKLFWDVMPLI